MMRVLTILAIMANMFGVAVAAGADEGVGFVRREKLMMRTGDLHNYYATGAVGNAPTSAPTSAPTDAPTGAPTDAPTDAPTEAADANDPTTTTTTHNYSQAEIDAWMAAHPENASQIPGTEAYNEAHNLTGKVSDDEEKLLFNHSFDWLAKPHTMHSNRTDVSYDYVTERLASVCEQHFQYMGDLTNEECAQKCFEMYGCTRFSAGGCKQGCRISYPQKNEFQVVGEPADIKPLPVQPDRQCIPTHPDTDSQELPDCILYQLTFYHAIKQPAACHGKFNLLKWIETKDQCAHACKNHGDCTKFSHEPNCLYGCRISIDSTGCEEDDTMGCAMYGLHTATGNYGGQWPPASLQ